MRKLWHSLLIASIFTALLTAIPLFAQSELPGPIDADIPFQFYAGDTLFPAGTYSITSVAEDPGGLLIRGPKDRVEAFLLTEPTRGETPAAQANLVFDRVGTHEFLSQVWDVGALTGFRIIEPRFERRLEHSGLSKKSHTVAAHRRKSK